MSELLDALYRGDQAGVAELLAARPELGGADPNLEQGNGFTALDAARQDGDERLEKLLRDSGAVG